MLFAIERSRSRSKVAEPASAKSSSSPTSPVTSDWVPSSAACSMSAISFSRFTRSPCSWERMSSSWAAENLAGRAVFLGFVAAVGMGFPVLGFVADVPTAPTLALFPGAASFFGAGRAGAVVDLRAAGFLADLRAVFLAVDFLAVVLFVVLLRDVGFLADLRVLFFAALLRVVDFFAVDLRDAVFLAADLWRLVFFVGFLRVDRFEAEVLRADVFLRAVDLLDLRAAVFLAGLMGAGR